MPRYVDAEERRGEILTAAYEILLDDGLPGVSFRTVAARLGGSATLVTHYYGSREELVEALLGFSVDRWKAELDSMETGIEDPKERLRVLLDWLVPSSEEGLKEERARLNLLANHGHDEETRAMLKGWDRYGRSVVRRYVRPLVPKEEVERTVEILRVTTFGLSLSKVQDPEAWTHRRQMKAIDLQLNLLGLDSGGP
jgi:AcrR family transcriptional regulator